MQKIALVAAVVLLCSITLVPAFSEDESQQSDNSQEKDDKFDFGDHSNKTLSFDDHSNKTQDDDDSDKKIGQEISDYIHKRNELEKEKRSDIIAALKACRQEAEKSENRTALQQCLQEFKSSFKQYHAFVFQQNAKFKQFRQGLEDHPITQDQNRQSLNLLFSQILHPNTFEGIHHTKNHKH